MEVCSSFGVIPTITGLLIIQSRDYEKTSSLTYDGFGIYLCIFNGVER